MLNSFLNPDSNPEAMQDREFITRKSLEALTALVETPLEISAMIRNTLYPTQQTLTPQKESIKSIIRSIRNQSLPKTVQQILQDLEGLLDDTENRQLA